MIEGLTERQRMIRGSTVRRAASSDADRPNE
jgi:hypothetical protein